ncbi:MAG: hypothetical protein ACLGH6_09645 [Gammaproteobacteria bacterium]
MDALEELLTMIRADTHGAASLVLFALVKTLSAQQGQYLFLLNKLRDLDAGQRQLAYRLMEAMAEGVNTTPAWQAKVVEMETAIRRG